MNSTPASRAVFLAEPIWASLGPKWCLRCQPPGRTFRRSVSWLSVLVRPSVRDVEFRILGPLEVVEGDEQVPVSGTKERALLAVLLIHAGEVVSADRLIDELWASDLPANPSNALQVVVSRVRRALEAAGAASQRGERLAPRK